MIKRNRTRSGRTIIAILALTGLVVSAIYLVRILVWPFGSARSAEESSFADVDTPIVVRVPGGMLEVASIQARRSYSEATYPTIFGRKIPVCRERAALDINYKITYRLRLGERWPIKLYNGRLIARVPELEPALPVAIDTRTLKRNREESCWFVLDMGTRDRVLTGISQNLEVKANSAASKDFVREKAVKTVREYLRVWILSQNYPNVPPDAPIIVLFPGQ